MKRHSNLGSLSIGLSILLAASAFAAGRQVQAKHGSEEADRLSNQQVLAAYGKVPLSFEENQGQTDRQVKFLSRGSRYALFLTSEEAVLVLRRAAPLPPRKNAGTRNTVFPEALGAGRQRCA